MKKGLLGGAGAALGLKVLTGVAVAAAAVTMAGAATTGSLSPDNWGQQVVDRVNACKMDLASGTRNIGQCVSEFAKTHGAMVSSGARHHGNDHSTLGAGNANGHGKGSGNGHGKPSGVPTPEDAVQGGGTHPTGAPTS